MTQPRVIDQYGGIFIDIKPVANPQAEMSAAFDNRLHQDVAEITQDPDWATVQFSTTTTAGPVAATVIAARSHLGVGVSQQPTVQKTATGLYTVTYPTTWLDPLGVTESLNFWDARGSVQSTSTIGHVQATATGNVINVAVWNSSNALSDLGGGVTISVTAK